MKIQKFPIFPVVFLFLLICLSASFSFAQPDQLTKDQLVDKSDTLYKNGRPREAIELIDKYPQFADETDVLYVKSVSLIELRDFKNADIAFQRQFDNFLKNAEETRKMNVKIAPGVSSSKLDQDMNSIMYSATLISLATAEMVNALRAAALEKAGIPANKREPKNLGGFEEFRKNYENTALEAAEFFLQTKQLKEALSNFSKAIELNPKNAAAYRGRAKVYRQQRKVKAAIADEAQAKKLSLKK